MRKYILIVCLGLFASCSNWLDVQPKTMVEEEEVFSRELGFKEALAGIYIKMATTDLYARNLSYGFIDTAVSGRGCEYLSECIVVHVPFYFNGKLYRNNLE